jgi:pimeloyl-ACP methyl ester carboxylesterase
VTASVLYFHGFASSPQSQKLVALQQILAPQIELNAPDLNVPSFEKLSFEGMARLGVERGRAVPPRVIVGSSLGAMVALEVVRRGIRAPLVLIAPAIGIGDRWHTRLEPGDPVKVFNHARGGQALIHRAFFDEMCLVHPDQDPPSVPVSIVMGRADESVPFEVVKTRWEQWTASGNLMRGSRFIEIAGGDHALVDWVTLLAREIVLVSGLE